MLFSDADKAIIRHYHEKQYTTYKIWKENPEKKWTKKSVSCLIKRYIKYGTMERQKGSGCPITATTKENEELVEELICSQEEAPGTHVTLTTLQKC